MPRKKQSQAPKISKPDRGGAAAVVVRKIVAFYGGKRTVTQKLGDSISRPLLVALCNGERPTTTASVAELCRVCPEDLAAELIAAHLQDELARIQGRYSPKGSVLTEGQPWSGETDIVITPAAESKDGSSNAASAALAAAHRLLEPFPDPQEILRKGRAKRRRLTG